MIDIFSSNLILFLLLLFILTTRMRVDSTRIVLFSISRLRVKSTRSAAHKSYRDAC
jgi:hypothetical protein